MKKFWGGSDRNICYFDCGDVYTGVYWFVKFWIKMKILEYFNLGILKKKNFI